MVDDSHQPMDLVPVLVLVPEAEPIHLQYRYLYQWLTPLHLVMIPGYPDDMTGESAGPGPKLVPVPLPLTDPIAADAVQCVKWCTLHRCRCITWSRLVCCSSDLQNNFQLCTTTLFNVWYFYINVQTGGMGFSTSSFAPKPHMRFELWGLFWRIDV